MNIIDTYNEICTARSALQNLKHELCINRHGFSPELIKNIRTAWALMECARDSVPWKGIAKHNKVQATRIYKDSNGCSLKEAYDAVNEYLASEKRKA